MNRDELISQTALQFVESRAFSRRRDELMNAAEYRALQLALIMNPRLGAVIPGSGGIRKLRWAIEGRGKQGGTRVIYYHAASHRSLALLLIYAKNEADDLTPDQRQSLRKLMLDEYG
jgi:hypothetical protein